MSEFSTAGIRAVMHDLEQKLAAEKSRADAEKSWAEDLAKQVCEMEDALGFKHDCTGPHGEFIPTMGPWKERVRDLIAKEGELEDEKSRADRAEAACAEMRSLLVTFRGWCHDYNLQGAVEHSLSTDSGKGWLSPEKTRLVRGCIQEMLEWHQSAEKEWLESVDITVIRDNCEQTLAALKEDA